MIRWYRFQVMRPISGVFWAFESLPSWASLHCWALVRSTASYRPTGVTRAELSVSTTFSAHPDVRCFLLLLLILLLLFFFGISSDFGDCNETSPCSKRSLTLIQVKAARSQTSWTFLSLHSLQACSLFSDISWTSTFSFLARSCFERTRIFYLYLFPIQLSQILDSGWRFDFVLQ